ncbi:hypothetical protein IWQ57_001379 [Coemansia nantahalensis]|uniref:Uncharacterized protein n=2 Tax=Coemansia TaxID=4863 RepID=A0ACC1L0C0_9FUNG|nr:hypothetical protein IWQ57_001379 [Coemansia nantahalensis]KAJ2798359.1 hypothetical protein H4R21_003961 [Coemansia helicoidea]
MAVLDSAAGRGGQEPERVRQRQAPFRDRVQAGRQLALGLREYADGRDGGGGGDVVVVSVSRGGAVVAGAAAAALGRSVPHMHYLVEAIPCPGLPGLSLGSVAGDGSVRLDDLVAGSVGRGAADPATLRAIRAVDRRLRRAQLGFCRPPPTRPDLDGRTVVVVDDGIEAGDTMRAAIMHLRHCFGPRRVVAATPVCLADARKPLGRHVDALVDVVSPLAVGAIPQWYASGATPSPAELRALARMFAAPQQCRPWTRE